MLLGHDPRYRYLPGITKCALLRQQRARGWFRGRVPAFAGYPSSCDLLMSVGRRVPYCLDLVLRVSPGLLWICS